MYSGYSLLDGKFTYTTPAQHPSMKDEKNSITFIVAYPRGRKTKGKMLYDEDDDDDVMIKFAKAKNGVKAKDT